MGIQGRYSANKTSSISYRSKPLSWGTRARENGAIGSRGDDHKAFACVVEKPNARRDQMNKIKFKSSLSAEK